MRKNWFNFFVGVCIILFAALWIAGGVAEARSKGKMRGKHHMANHNKPSGVSQWIKQFGTADDESAVDIAVDPAGNSYVTGYTSGAFAGTNIGYIYVAKYDTSGNQIWITQFGADGAFDIAVDSDGNSYVTGFTSGGLAGKRDDIFIAKYDTSSNQIWITQFGSADDDYGYGIAVDSDGNSYVTGYTSGGLAGTNIGHRDIFIAKYNTSGNQIWIKQFGSANADYGYGIAVDSAGNSYVTGYTIGDLSGTGNARRSDAFIAKYDTFGNQIWVAQFGSAAEDEGYGIAVDSAGNSYVTGYTKFDLAGTNSRIGYKDIFIAKYDTFGNQIWIKQFGSANDDVGSDIAVDSAGNSYVTGYTRGDLSETNIGYKDWDIFIAKYDVDGTLWIRQFGSAEDDLANGIAVDSAGNNYITGYTDGDLVGTNIGGRDIFIAKNYESSPQSSGVTYSLGGTVSDLTETIELEFNAKYQYPDGSRVLVNGLTVLEENGPFVLGEFEDGFIYDGLEIVTHLAPCSVTNSSGTINGADVTDILVECFDVPFFTDIAAGSSHTVTLKFDGTVWTWGSNGRGELGNGTTARSAMPVQVIGLTDVTAIAAGAVHTVALKSDGTVWAWGSNSANQLGTITEDICRIAVTDEPCSYTPVQVTELTDVTAIAAGAHHTVALKSDGTVWAWGPNDFGQLGAETTETCTSPWGYSYPCSSTPVQVNELTDVTAIAVGSSYTVALKFDGTVWAWGSNSSGQLGAETTETCTFSWGSSSCSSTPIQVNGLADVTAITARNSHSIALKTDSTVWEWPWESSFSGPVQVSELTDVIGIAAGGQHSIALKSDGTVWTWGDNSDGQLGDGTRISSSVPVQVSDLVDITAIAGGHWFSIALKSDDTIWGWGDNYSGQFGNGTTGNASDTPIQTLWLP